MANSYDVIIIGAGAMGSAAAYHLSKAGQRVLLLEQFEIDHQYGSSYGYSRIIRYSYDHDLYVKLAKATYPMWFALEQESGERLYIQTGGLDFGLPDNAKLQATLQTVRDMNIPHEILAPREAEKRFPQFKFDDEMTVLYQPDSGVIQPSKCVKAHIRLARAHGATVLDYAPATQIDVKADSVNVHTPQGIHSAARLIITAGAWAGRLLKSLDVTLPLQPIRCQEAHFFPTHDVALHNAPTMPVFIFHTTAYYMGFSGYGLPSVDGSGVKAAFHGGPAFEHPSELDYKPDMAHIENIRAFTRRHLPAIGSGEVGLTRHCLYTMTPDEHFIIDQHPQHRHVVIASPCSGHGFKFSTIIGKIVGDLAIQGKTDYDISLFKLSRFGI